MIFQKAYSKKKEKKRSLAINNICGRKWSESAFLATKLSRVL
jgi:hypothetical protein